MLLVQPKGGYFTSECFFPIVPVIKADQLVEEIETMAAAVPVNPNGMKEEFLENLQANLDSGFITQEEYDTMLAQSQQYASIVSK